MNPEPQLPFLFWLRILTKRKLLIGSIFSASDILATVASSLMPKVYRGETTWRLARGKDPISGRERDLISAKEFVDMLGDTKSRERIAILFPKHSEFIRRVALSELKGSPDKLSVVIESERIEVIPDAFAELMSYLNHNPLLERFVQQSYAVLQKQIHELDIVIKQSTETQATFDRLLREGRLLPVGFNPLELSKRVGDLHVEKLSLEQSMSNLFGVEAAERIFVLRRPVRPRTALNVALAAAMGLVVGVGLALVLELVDRLGDGHKA